MHETQVDTTFDEDKFQFNPPNLKVFQIDGDIGVQWTDSYPCIKSYEVILRGTNNDNVVETVLVKEETSESKVFSVQLMKLLAEKEDFELKQCSSYQIAVHPKLDSLDPKDSGEWESANAKTEQLFYFTHPQPPDELAHEELGDDSALVKWHHSPCHTGYRLLLTAHGTGSVIVNVSHPAEEGSEILLGGLTPCTQYNVSVWSEAEGGEESSAPSNHAFTTDHSDEVQAAASVTVEAVTLDFVLHGTDCVVEYKVFLCDNAVERSCKSRAVTPGESVEFDLLQDGTIYSYQLTGYNSMGVEVFVSPERVVTTKKRVSARLAERKITDDSFELTVDSSLFKGTEKPADGSWWTEVACKSAKSLPVRSAASNETVLDFNGLVPHTRYVCSGEFHYEGGKEYVEIPAETFQTLDGVPGPPKHLVNRNSRMNAVELAWSPPDVPNGVLKGYVLSVRPDCKPENAFCPAECQKAIDIEVGADTLSHTVTTEPDTRYTATVSARTRHPGEGQPSKALEISTFPTSPSAPVITKTHAPSRNSLLLHFEPRCPLTGPTNFTAHYECKGCIFPSKRTHVKRKDADTFEITGLEGGHFYDAWVTARTDGCVDDEGDCEASSDRKAFFVECDYKCKDGTCINGRGWRLQCDFIRDCPDGSDEVGCVCEPPLHWKCSNGYCVDAAKR